MRPLLLGLAATVLFLGSLIMAPLTADIAGSTGPTGAFADPCLGQQQSAASLEFGDCSG
ncbi:MAG: hypothetical protein WBB07_23210 [Mycobacterium sp.]